ncbi:MAG: TetR/AcrR family transcriptional regulator [Pseudomonadota bacterium]
MLAEDRPGGETRSDRRIPKLRTRGRANRERLLSEAQRLIEAQDGTPLRFSDVFEAAGVSRGSAYRIYNGIDDLMQDLASTWINDFVVHLRSVNLDAPVKSWQQLSDQIVIAGVDYWKRTAKTLRVLPRVRVNAPESYRLAVRDMTTAVAEIFEARFVIPAIANWHDAISLYVQLGDTIFSDSVRRDGNMSARRVDEAKILLSNYLSFYLPATLPPR